jgi:hypothetical protein
VFDTKPAIQPELSEAPEGRLHAATLNSPKLTLLTSSLKKYKQKYKIQPLFKMAEKCMKRKCAHACPYTPVATPDLEVRSSRSIHNVAL